MIRTAYEQADPGYRQQLLRVDEQSQRQEHNQLEQPREAVEEGDYALFVQHLAVADHQSGQVDG